MNQESTCPDTAAMVLTLPLPSERDRVSKSSQRWQKPRVLHKPRASWDRCDCAEQARGELYTAQLPKHHQVLTKQDREEILYLCLSLLLQYMGLYFDCGAYSLEKKLFWEKGRQSLVSK